MEVLVNYNITYMLCRTDKSCKNTDTGSDSVVEAQYIWTILQTATVNIPTH